MYPQKYTTTTATGTAGTNGAQPRTTNGSSATNQYLNNRSSVRSNHSSYDSQPQLQLHNNNNNNNGSHTNNGGGAGASPMRSPPPAELQRRESLVKPTWANISPGQVPSSTFDELVSSANNNGHHDRGGGGVGNGGGSGGTGFGFQEGETQSELGMLSNKLLAKNGLNQRQKRREVELYDIFGKVCMATRLRIRIRSPVSHLELKGKQTAKQRVPETTCKILIFCKFPVSISI